MGIGHRPAHRGAPENRVAAVSDALNINEIAGIGAHPGVIAGIFPEGALVHEFVGIHFAFHNDFRMGRYRQIDGFTLDHLSRFSTQGAVYVIFGYKSRYPGRSQYKEQRVAPDHSGHRHGFFHGLIFFKHDIGMLAFDKLSAQFIFTKKLAAISTHIDPVGFRIFTDDEMRSSEETTAVERIKFRGRELEQIDLVIHHDIFFTGGAR